MTTPQRRTSRTCSYCTEALAAHHTGETHPECEAPHAAALAAEQEQATAELHAWLESLWAEAELESSHDLDADRLLGVG